MKLCIIAAFSAFPMNLRSPLRAFNCIAALEHKVDIHGFSQKGKRFCVLHELGNKFQLGLEPLSGFSGRSGGKSFRTFNFSLKASMI